jgi:nitrogenase molybdenum-cofactor synthesis protein NifE
MNNLDRDDLICNCMGVTKGKIIDTIKSKNLFTVQDVSDETGAGTGCHSCFEDIEDILKEVNQ